VITPPVVISREAKGISHVLPDWVTVGIELTPLELDLRAIRTVCAVVSSLRTNKWPVTPREGVVTFWFTEASLI
jgi:hypothetical protein